VQREKKTGLAWPAATRRQIRFSCVGSPLSLVGTSQSWAKSVQLPTVARARSGRVGTSYRLFKLLPPPYLLPPDGDLANGMNNSVQVAGREFDPSIQPAGNSVPSFAW
jgi:hypothetical protein